MLFSICPAVTTSQVRMPRITPGSGGRKGPRHPVPTDQCRGQRGHSQRPPSRSCVDCRLPASPYGTGHLRNECLPQTSRRGTPPCLPASPVADGLASRERRERFLGVLDPAGTLHPARHRRPSYLQGWHVALKGMAAHPAFFRGHRPHRGQGSSRLRQRCGPGHEHSNSSPPPVAVNRTLYCSVPATVAVSVSPRLTSAPTRPLA